MINMKIVIAAAAAVVFANAAQAQMAVSADIGTTGIGAHLIVPMEKTLNGRFGGNFLNFSHDDRAGNVDYAMKAKLRSFDILFDWYVFGDSPLHATAGVVYNGNKVSATARPDAGGNYMINDKYYAATTVGSLTGKLEYHKAAPYLGIGWGNPLAGSKSWTLTGDLGAMFQGKPTTSLFNVGCQGTNVACAALGRDIGVENQKFKDDVDSYKVYPVLRVGIAYRF